MRRLDPSGHNWLRKVLMIVVVIIAMVATFALGFLLQGLGSAIGGTIGTAVGNFGGGMMAISGIGASFNAATFTSASWVGWGAAASGALGGYSAAKAGGSASDILKAGTIAGLTAAVSAMTAGGLHGLGTHWHSALTPGITLGEISISHTVAHVAAHGAVGGAMSEAVGGSFRDGFIGAVISAGVSGVTNALWGGTDFMNAKTPWAVAGRTVLAGVVGGAASVATGGEFAHAALTSAFLHLYNEELVRGRLNLFSPRDSMMHELARTAPGGDAFLVFRHSTGSAVIDNRLTTGHGGPPLDVDQVLALMVKAGYKSGEPVIFVGCGTASHPHRSFAQRFSARTGGIAGGAFGYIFVGRKPYLMIAQTKLIQRPGENGNIRYEEVPTNDPAYMRWFKGGHEVKSQSWHFLKTNHGESDQFQLRLPLWLKQNR